MKYHFYTPRDSIHLSRSGIRRLLGAINEHVTVVENFHKCVFASHKPQQPPITLTEKQPYDRQSKQTNISQPRKTCYTKVQQGSTAYQSSDNLHPNWECYTHHQQESAELTERCMNPMF